MTKPLTQNHLGSSSYAQKTIGKGLKPAKPRNFLFENPGVLIHTRVFGHSGMDSCLSEYTGMVTMSDHGSDSSHSGSRGKAKSSSSKTSSVLSDAPFKVWFWENKSLPPVQFKDVVHSCLSFLLLTHFMGAHTQQSQNCFVCFYFPCFIQSRGTLKDLDGIPMIQLAARGVRMAWHVIAKIVPEPLLKAWFCYFLAVNGFERAK